MKDVEISLENQLAKVYLKEGERLEPAALRGAIKKADFTAGEIRMDATGEVRLREDSTLELSLPSPEQKFVLQAFGAEKEEKAGFEKLRQRVASGASHFAVSGIVHEPKKGGLVLGVVKFEIPTQKEK